MSSVEVITCRKDLKCVKRLLLYDMCAYEIGYDYWAMEVPWKQEVALDNELDDAN